MRGMVISGRAHLLIGVDEPGARAAFEAMRQAGTSMDEQTLDQHQRIDAVISELRSLADLDLGHGGMAYLVQASVKMDEVRRRAPQYPRHKAFHEPQPRVERGCPVD